MCLSTFLKAIRDFVQFLRDIMVMAKLADFVIIRNFVLTSSSPLEIAAKMAHRYRELSAIDKERTVDMDETSDFCEEMAAELMALAAANKDPGEAPCFLLL